MIVMKPDIASMIIFFLYKIVLRKETYVKIISPRKDKDRSLIQLAIQSEQQQILSVQYIYCAAISKSNQI